MALTQDNPLINSKTLTKDDYESFKKKNAEIIAQRGFSEEEIEEAYLNVRFRDAYGQAAYDNSFKNRSLASKRSYMRLATGQFNDEYKRSPLAYGYPSYTQTPLSTREKATVVGHEEEKQDNPPAQTNSNLYNRMISPNSSENKYGVPIEDLTATDKMKSTTDLMLQEAKRLKPNFWEKFAATFDESGQSTEYLNDRELKYNQIQKALRGEGISEWVKDYFKLDDNDITVYNKTQDKLKNEKVLSEDVIEFANKAKAKAAETSPMYKGRIGTKWLQEGKDFTEEDLAEQWRQYLLNKEEFGEGIANHKLDNYFRDIVSKNENAWDVIYGGLQKGGANLVGNLVTGVGIIEGMATAPFRPEENLEDLNWWQNYWAKALTTKTIELGSDITKYGTIFGLDEARSRDAEMSIWGGTRPSSEIDGNFADQFFSWYTVPETASNVAFTVASIWQGNITNFLGKGVRKGAARYAAGRVRRQVARNTISSDEAFRVLRHNISTINKVQGYADAVVTPSVVSMSEAAMNGFDTYNQTVRELKDSVDGYIDMKRNEQYEALNAEFEKRKNDILNNPELRKKYEEQLMSMYKEQERISREQYLARHPEASRTGFLNVDYTKLPNYQQDLEATIHNDLLDWYKGEQNRIDTELNAIAEDSYGHMEAEARLAGINDMAVTQVTNFVLDGTFRRALYPLSTQRSITQTQKSISNLGNRFRSEEKAAKREARKAEKEFKKKFRIKEDGTIEVKEPTFFNKTKNVLKEPLSESLAENIQTASSSAAQHVAEFDMAQYIESRINGDADEDWSRSTADGYWEYLKGIVNAELGSDSKETWMATVQGGLGAAMPLFHVRLANYNQGTSENRFGKFFGRAEGESRWDAFKRELPFRWAPMDAYREVANTTKMNRATAERLNHFLVDADGRHVLDNMNGIKTWMAMAEYYAEEGNEFGNRTAQFKALSSSMDMLHELRGTETGKAILNQLKAIAKSSNDSQLMQEAIQVYKAEHQGIGNTMTDEEIADKVKKKASEVLNVYDRIGKAKESISNSVMGGATPEVISALAANQLLSEDLDRRQSELENKLKVGTIATKPKTLNDADYNALYFGKKENIDKELEKAQKLYENIKKTNAKLKSMDALTAKQINDEKRAKARIREIEKKRKENWNEDRVFSENEILNLSPIDRAFILDDANRHLYSQEQLDVIDNVKKEQSQDNPNFVKDIKDAALIQKYNDRIKGEHIQVLANPKDMNMFASMARERQQIKNIEYKYKHIGNIKDYKTFVENIKEALNNAPMKERMIADIILKDNTLYKQYKNTQEETNSLESELNKNKLFSTLDESIKQQAKEVIGWLRNNNDSIPLNNTSELLQYITDNSAKLGEYLKEIHGEDVDVTKYIDSFRNIKTTYDSIKAEEAKARKEAEALDRALEETPNSTITEEEEKAIKEEQDRLQEERKNSPEELEKDESITKLQENNQVPEEIKGKITQLASRNREILPYVIDMVTYSFVEGMGEEELDAIKKSWSTILDKIISEEDTSFVSMMTNLVNSILNEESLTGENTSSFLLDLCSEINSAMVSGYSDNKVEEAIKNSIGKAFNSNSSTMFMSEVGEYQTGEAYRLYKEWGIDTYLDNPNNLVKLKDATVYYVALDRETASKMVPNTLQMPRYYPIVSVVEDANGPLEIGGKKYQPIGFVINSGRGDLAGSKMASVIRTKAYIQQPTTTGYTTPTIIDGYTTKGVIIKPSPKQRLYSKVTNSLKELIEKAKSRQKESEFNKKFYNNVYVSVNSVGKKTIFYKTSNGKIGGEETPILIKQKEIGTVVNPKGKRFLDVLESDNLEDFKHFNEWIEEGLDTLLSTIEDDPTANYAVQDNNTDSEKKAIEKRVEKLQRAVNNFIHISEKNIPYRSAFDEAGNQYIYVEILNTNTGNLEQKKLFTVRRTDGAVTKNSLATDLKEALKDPQLRKWVHFQVVLDNLNQLGSDGRVQSTPNSYKYLKRLIDNDILEANTVSLLSVYLPTTHLESNSQLHQDIVARDSNFTPLSVNRKTEATEEQENQQEIQEEQPETPEEAPKPKEKPTVETIDITQEANDDVDIFAREVDDLNRDTWNRESEIAWLQRVLPQMLRDDLVVFQEGLIRLAGNKKAWGTVEGALMTLSTQAAKGTTYHEAYHIVFDNLLDSSRKAKLYKEARELYGNNLSLTELEERMAEGFREYVEKRIIPQTTGGKIKEWFHELLTKIVYWVTGKNAIENLYREINKGNFKNKNLTYSRVQQVTDIRQSDIEEFSKELIDNNKQGIEEILKSILGRPLNEEELSELKKVSNNPFKFTAYINKLISSVGNQLSEELNSELDNIKEVQNTKDIDRRMHIINKYINGERLNIFEQHIIDNYNRRYRGNSNWMYTELDKLSKQLENANKVRNESLDKIRNLQLKLQTINQANLLDAILDNKDNLENTKVGEIWKKAFTPKTSDNASTKAPTRLSIEKFTIKSINTLEKIGISPYEYNSYPEEVQERIKECCSLELV